MADPKPDIVKSPIIMKVDGPAEENEDNEQNERTEELTACSPARVLRKPVLSSSKLGNPFGVNNFKPLPGGSILKAPVLNSIAIPKAPFALNPSKLSFGRNVGTTSESGDTTRMGVLKGAVTSSSEGDRSNSNGANAMQTLRFVPLLADTTTGKMDGGGKAIISTSASSAVGVMNSTNSNIKTSSSSGFVFGQNLKERVIGDPHITTSTLNSSQPSSTSCASSATTTSSSSNPIAKSVSVVVSSSNGIAICGGDSPSPPSTSLEHEHNAVATTSGADNKGDSLTDLGEGCSHGSASGSLFSTVIREREQEQRGGATMAADVSSTSGKSLSESAREWEEQRANKRKYEEVEVRTGEEEETNVAQVSCKLFAWVGGSWAERGRGILRLNDREVLDDVTGTCYQQSRLVFRTSGSLRVILNTKIWSGMEVKEASSKSLILTAMDGAARLYLLNAAQDDIRHLHRLVTARVRVDSLRTQGNPPNTTHPSSSEVAMAAVEVVATTTSTSAVAASSEESGGDAMDITKTAGRDGDVCSSSQEVEEQADEAE